VLISDDRPQFARQNPNAQNRRGKPEHFMPDLKNPSAEGTKMQPKFFLTSATLPFGTPDAERREKAAEWMTANPWFATAYVNRIWGELVGEGFYQPIDDIGPDRKPSAPKTVELLSRGFAKSGYDMKWLFQTICATQAYQRQSRPRREPDGTPFAANSPRTWPSHCAAINSSMQFLRSSKWKSPRTRNSAVDRWAACRRMAETRVLARDLKSRSATIRATRAKPSSARSRKLSR
jgi:hypothetical protein